MSTLELYGIRLSMHGTPFKMNILLVIPSLSSYEGGIVSSTTNFALALARNNQDITIACLEDGDSFKKAAQLRKYGIEVVLIKVIYKSALSFFPLIEFFKTHLKDYEICYIHGLWLFPQLVAAHYARKFKIPYIVAVHGMLSPWALGNKRIKKQIYWILFEKRNLRQAKAIHALNHNEKRSILEKVGSKIDIIVIPNGLSVNSTNTLKIRERECNKTILSLCRLNKSKGLDMLISAFANLTGRYPGWNLIIAGPDEGNYKRILVEITKRNKIENKVQFVGKVSGKRKEELFLSSDLFVLPSYSEGFSVVLLEAMQYSLPLLFTTKCNFPEAAETGAGIEVTPTKDTIQNELARLIEMSPEQRSVMGERGFRLITKKYTMDNIARQLRNHFENILKG